MAITFSRFLPGIALCALGMGLALVVNHWIPAVSTLLAAIVLGAVLTNTVGVPRVARDGVGFTSKRLLRTGIVLLGMQVVAADILHLGLPILLTIVLVVAIGVVGTIALGKAMGIEEDLVLLIACGFSICGAAAVAGAESVVRAKVHNVMAALGLVVLFGTATIPLIPGLGHVLGLTDEAIGVWAGASAHEVAQVVAIAGTLGGDSLEPMKLAVITKLGRVVLLAVVLVGLGWYLRRSGRHFDAPADQTPNVSKAPLVPAFVLGFLAMVALASIDHYLGIIPAGVYSAAQLVQSILLAMAMFGLGCGVKIADLRAVGWKPVALAAIMTGVVMAIGVTGVFVAF